MTENHIFISYSHKDGEFMRKLRSDLENRGLPIWCDDNLIPGTPSWKRAIEDALENASCVVVIFSPDAKQSEWVRKELDYAEVKRLPIFPLLAFGDDQSSIPFGFTATEWIDMRTDYSAGFVKLENQLKHFYLFEYPRPQEENAYVRVNAFVAYQHKDEIDKPLFIIRNGRRVRIEFLNVSPIISEQRSSYLINIYNGVTPTLEELAAGETVEFDYIIKNDKTSLDFSLMFFDTKKREKRETIFSNFNRKLAEEQEYLQTAKRRYEANSEHEPAPKIILQVGKWIITDFGIEYLGHSYYISKFMLYKEDIVHHVSTKTWVNLEEFLIVVYYARQIHSYLANLNKPEEL